LKIVIAKFETLLNKILSHSVYFEIKHQKWSTCVSFLSTRVCVKFGWKSGYRHFGKTA